MAVNIIVILLLSSLVEITVEIKEVAPSLGDIMEVSVSLLAHVNKMLTSHSVVQHSSSLDFLVDLSSEESSLFFKIVDLSSRVGKHVGEGTLSILERVHGFINFIRLDTPFLHVLPLEKPLLIL